MALGSQKASALQVHSVFGCDGLARSISPSCAGALAAHLRAVEGVTPIRNEGSSAQRAGDRRTCAEPLPHGKQRALLSTMLFGEQVLGTQFVEDGDSAQHIVRCERIELDACLRA